MCVDWNIARAHLHTYTERAISRCATLVFALCSLRSGGGRGRCINLYPAIMRLLGRAQEATHLNNPHWANANNVNFSSPFTSPINQPRVESEHEKERERGCSARKFAPLFQRAGLSGISSHSLRHLLARPPVCVRARECVYYRWVCTS